MAISNVVWDLTKKLTGSVSVVFLTPSLRSRAKGCLIGYAKALLAGGSAPRAPSELLGVYDVVPDSLRHAHAAELVALRQEKSKGELSNYRYCIATTILLFPVVYCCIFVIALSLLLSF